MFVLQIGSVAQTDSCNMDLGEPNTVDKAVLLQYSINNGITWHVIAQHQPKDFIQAQRVSYNIPLEARVKGVQLRWWQPRHNGTGHDQWALDHVEVVLTDPDPWAGSSLPPQIFLSGCTLPSSCPAHSLTCTLFCYLLPLAWH
ncbi:UNVERIFIED_CONTAM: hypothetical protein FKN15_063857 [Acipenser sinensis]